MLAYRLHIWPFIPREDGKTSMKDYKVYNKSICSEGISACMFHLELGLAEKIYGDLQLNCIHEQFVTDGIGGSAISFPKCDYHIKCESLG